MVFFNWATMQMAAKIVYYGPGLCGKTSNLSYIYAKTAPGSRGEMVSLETESDRTLFFDLLPIEVGTIGGFKTRLQLYTVPGQVFYNTTRKLVLKGLDGLVFVADSQRPMRDANMESFATLKENLKEFGLALSDLPIVLQYNKRDLSNILSVDELNADLNPEREFLFCEASAVTGDGVITTLKEITKLTLKKLRTRMSASDGATKGSARVASPTVRAVKSPQPASPISARTTAPPTIHTGATARVTTSFWPYRNRCP
jgi:signal recognition particle receptor subunit beta